MHEVIRANAESRSQLVFHVKRCGARMASTLLFHVKREVSTRSEIPSGLATTTTKLPPALLPRDPASGYTRSLFLGKYPPRPQEPLIPPRERHRLIPLEPERYRRPFGPTQQIGVSRQFL